MAEQRGRTSGSLWLQVLGRAVSVLRHTKGFISLKKRRHFVKQIEVFEDVIEGWRGNVLSNVLSNFYFE